MKAQLANAPDSKVMVEQLGAANTGLLKAKGLLEAVAVFLLRLVEGFAFTNVVTSQ